MNSTTSLGSNAGSATVGLARDDKNQSPTTFRTQLSLKRNGPTADERLPKVAAPHVVHVLFHLQDVVRPEFVQRLGSLGCEVGRNHRREFGFAQILQAVHGEHSRELVEVNRPIVFLQVLVVQVRRIRTRDDFELVSQQPLVRSVLKLAGVGDELDECLGLYESRAQIVELHAVVAHHVANDAANVPSGVRVVAHVGHAVRSQVLPADFEDPFLHRLRHPREHAVTNDVIELAEVRAEGQNVAVLQLDVFESERFDGGPAVGDLNRGGVDAEEPGLRVVVGERDEVAAGAAAEFEYAGRLDRGRLEAEDARDACQSLRTRLRERHAAVRDCVVRSGGHGELRAAVRANSIRAKFCLEKRREAGAEPST